MHHLYLSSHDPRNCTYSDEKGRLFYKVETAQRHATIYRSLPDLHLPTSERQLWEERHYLETHPSWCEHPEWEGRGSGFPQDDVIVEERRDPSMDSRRRQSCGSSYEFRSLSDAQAFKHPDDHPFFTKEHWAHYAEIEFHAIHSTLFNVAGNEVKASELFQKEGWSFFGRNRIFTHKGQQYRWEMGRRKVSLYHHTGTPSDSDSSSSSADANDVLVAEFIPSRWDRRGKRKYLPRLTIASEFDSLSDIILITFLYVERLRSEREENPPAQPRASMSHDH